MFLIHRLRRSDRLVMPLGAMLLLVFASQNVGAQDAAAGEKIFKRCANCHSLEAGKKKTGPSLAGLFGRRAGSIPDFNYSKAMKVAEFTWSPELLDRYLADPKGFVPGNRMPFPGLKEPADRQALIDYLETATAHR